MPLDLSKKQVQGLGLLMDPLKKFILFTGGSRCGKTYLIMEYLVGRAYQFPGSRQLIVRKHLTDARGSIWNDSLSKYLKMYIPDSEYTMNKTELRVIFNNGSEIILGGLDDGDRLQKILGNEYITVFGNEATELEYETIQILITRLAQRVPDRDGKFYATNKMILDCNPQTPRHWLKIWGIDFKDPSVKPPQPLADADKHASLHWIPQDNIKYLPPGFIESLNSLPEMMRERMLFGRWCGGTGVIFKEFNERKHVIKPFPIPRSWGKFRAIDFGYNHPFACIYGAHDFVTNTIYIYRELKYAGMTIDEIADLLNKTQRESNEFYERTWADHDKSDRMFLQKKGIFTSPARKSVLDGINAVSQRLLTDSKLQRPRLLIFDTCKNLIDELYSYTWYESNSEVTDKDSPIKIDDDCVDAARYLVYGIDKSGGGLI